MAIRVTVKSARHNRKNWKEDLPPEGLRIQVKDAIRAAGNGSQLAKALGITRGAVYQWKPPYRHDPYLPLKMAIRFVSNDKLMKAYREVT